MYGCGVAGAEVVGPGGAELVVLGFLVTVVVDGTVVVAGFEVVTGAEVVLDTLEVVTGTEVLEVAVEVAGTVLVTTVVEDSDLVAVLVFKIDDAQAVAETEEPTFTFDDGELGLTVLEDKAELVT